MNSAGREKAVPNVTPEQRQRASLAIRARMNETGATVPSLAKKAGIDQATIRSLLSAQRWPRKATLVRLNKALGWPEGEINRRAELRPELQEFTSVELIAELYRRARAKEQMSRAG